MAFTHPIQDAELRLDRSRQVLGFLASQFPELSTVDYRDVLQIALDSLSKRDWLSSNLLNKRGQS